MCDYKVQAKGSPTKHSHPIHECSKYKCDFCEHEVTERAAVNIIVVHAENISVMFVTRK